MSAPGERFEFVHALKESMAICGEHDVLSEPTLKVSLHLDVHAARRAHLDRVTRYLVALVIHSKHDALSLRVDPTQPWVIRQRGHLRTRRDCPICALSDWLCRRPWPEVARPAGGDKMCHLSIA